MVTLIVRLTACCAGGSGLEYAGASVIPNTLKKYPHHYQCNDPLSLLKTLKAAGVAVAGPAAIAEAMLANIKPALFVGKLEVGSGGFINITLDSRQASFQP